MCYACAPRADPPRLSARAASSAQASASTCTSWPRALAAPARPGRHADALLELVEGPPAAGRRFPGATVVDARVPGAVLNLAWHRLEWPPVETLAGAVDVVHSMHPLLMPARRAAQVVTFTTSTSSIAPERHAGARSAATTPRSPASHARRADARRRRSRNTRRRRSIARLGVPARAHHRLPARRAGVGAGGHEPRRRARSCSSGRSSRARTSAACSTPTRELLAPQPGRARRSSSPAASHRRASRCSTMTRAAARAAAFDTSATSADDERERLYREASMLVLPSLDEGFGMPALEAMTIGVPVVVVDARRAAGSRRRRRRCSSIRTTSPALAAAMERVLSDPALRADAARPRASRARGAFSWDASAARLSRPTARRSSGAGRARDRPLRIGIDARELLGDDDRRRPLSRRAAARAGRRGPTPARRRFVLYAPEPLPLDASAPARPRSASSAGRAAAPGGSRRTCAGPSARDPPDVFFAPAYTAPLGVGVPLAVTIHDISFVAHPEWFRAARRPAAPLADAPRRAHAPPSSSPTRSSRGASSRRISASTPSRIDVIPPGRHRRGRRRGRDRARAAGALRRLALQPPAPARPDRRLRARDRATCPTARLVIVGDDRTWPPQDLPAVAAAHGVGGADRAPQLRRPTTSSRALYARASVFAFLSEYEGFGLTPLEALAAGVPPVVLDTPVAREVYGDAAVYVAPRRHRAARPRRSGGC